METAPMPETKDRPSALAILETIEARGYSLTLELRGTAQKWVTGRNLFMGICAPSGLHVRNAYGPISIEMPLRVAADLNWHGASGEQLADHAQALRNTIRSGKVRRNSHIYRALVCVAQWAR